MKTRNITPKSSSTLFLPSIILSQSFNSFSDYRLACHINWSLADFKVCLNYSEQYISLPLEWILTLRLPSDGGHIDLISKSHNSGQEIFLTCIRGKLIIIS